MMHRFILAVFVTTLIGCSSLLAPNVKTQLLELRGGEYKIDPAHSSLVFKVSHLGLSTFVGRFNQFDARLDFNPDNTTLTQLNAVVEMASVDVNNRKLEKLLLNNSWFNVEKHPQASYTSTAVTALADNRFMFIGDLSFLNVTAPVTLEGVFHGGAVNILTGRYTLGFSATGQINRSGFGLDKYPAYVGDEVSLEIHAEFLKL